MSTPSSIADFLNRLGPVAVAKLDAYPIKTNVERSVTGDMVNSAFQDFANLVADLLSQKQGVLTFDNTPAAGSSNPVTSAGIAAAITNQIAAALVGYMTQPQVAAAITAALAPYSTTAQTAQQIAQAIGAALADYSTTAQMQTAIGDAINTALAAYDTHAEVVQEIADAITAALTGYVTGEQMTTAIAAALTDYVTTAAMNTALAGKQDKLTVMGSTTKPVYVYADGTLAPCDDYAGGTKVVLNGEDKGGKSISIYAPTGKGNAEQYYGSKAPDAPGWVTPDNAPTEGSGKLVKSGGIFTAIANAVTGAINTVKTWAEGLFAKIDGYYQTLTAGAAENLVGHGTTPAVISFRPAGGTQDIGSGAASIAKIKGRTDGWNQIVKNGDFSEGATDWARYGTAITFNVQNNACVCTCVDATQGADASSITQKIYQTSGHTYLLMFKFTTETTLTPVVEWIGFSAFGPTSMVNLGGGRYARIFTPTAASANRSILFKPNGTRVNGDTWTWENIVLYDLTLQYGAGREHATAAAFLAEYPEALTALYNAGKLINNKVTALVTDGFNQWNEVWEQGKIDTTTGANVADTSRIRSKNFIPVFSSTSYCITIPIGSTNSAAIVCYDYNKNFIRTQYANGVFTTPADCYYIRFFFSKSEYGSTTYRNDIAINLSHSGIRNGEYEPYWISTLNIVHSQIWGKLNGAGEMVQVAPNGFRGVGANYDEIDLVRKEAYIRRAWVDMGTLNWTYESGSSLMYAPLAGLADPGNPRRVPLACAKYVGIYDGSTLENTPDKSIFNRTAPNLGVMVKDSAYTDPAAFKTAMDGVMLDYQLATPLYYTDLMYSEDGGQTFVEIPSNYRVDDFGTERRLPDGIVDGAPASTPLVADIAYAMNAVDTLRRLPQTYLSKESTENLLAALQTAGVIAGYTMTYDDTNEEYDFTITPNA